MTTENMSELPPELPGESAPKMPKAKVIRAAAWKALGEGQYWPFVGGMVVASLIAGCATIPAIVVMAFCSVAMKDAAPGAGAFIATGFLVALAFIPYAYALGFATWGFTRMALAADRRELKFELFSSGKGHGWKMLWIFLVRATYIQLWLLLLIVPGIRKAFSYAMTDFVAVDHPDWTANACIAESSRLMKGHRWEFFCLSISFIGWYLLIIPVAMFVPCGGFANFLLQPYIFTANANFYAQLKAADALAPCDAAPPAAPAAPAAPSAAATLATATEVTDYTSLGS